MDFPTYHDRAHSPERYYRRDADLRPDREGYGGWGPPRGRGRGYDSGILRPRRRGGYARGFDIGPSYGGPDVELRGHRTWTRGPWGGEYDLGFRRPPY